MAVGIRGLPGPPAEWPDFPHHSLLFQYFKDYVAHFGLRDKITFNTSVDHAERGDDGLWTVTLSTGETRAYDALIVCNGHHWDPNTPPDYPGQFDGTLMHSHEYNDPPFDPIDMRGKNVVVVGMGNSGLDIASELSQRFLAKKLTVSARRGVWVLPKYLGGKAGDKMSAPAWMPRSLSLALSRRFLRKNIGTMEGYGLPKPDHQPFEAHPSASGEFLGKAGSGRHLVQARHHRAGGQAGALRRRERRRRRRDHLRHRLPHQLPVLHGPEPVARQQKPIPTVQADDEARHRQPLLHGLAQPMPTLVNFAEQQSKLVAAYLAGKYQPPSPSEMRSVLAADEKYYLGPPYYESPRHTIQCEFDPYVRNLKKEIADGGKRARLAGNALPVPARALQNA